MGHDPARKGGFGRDILTVRAKFFNGDTVVAGVGLAEWPRWDLSGLGVDGRQLGGDFVADCSCCFRGERGSRW